MSSTPRTPWGEGYHFEEADANETGEDENGPIGPGTAIVGAIAVLLALYLLVDRDVAAGLSLDYLPVIVVGGVILFRAGQLGYRRLSRTVSEATLPDVEERTTVTIPGNGFDRLLSRSTGSVSARLQREETITRRLRRVASRVLELDGAVSRDQSTDEALDTGNWTADPVAAALFTGKNPSGSMLGRLRSFGRRSTPVPSRARHVIDDLATRMDIEHVEGDESTDGALSGTTNDPSAPEQRRTGRWNGLTALALGALGIGTLTGRSPLVVLAGIVLALGTYLLVWSEPTTDLAITRTIATTDPSPGDAVHVTVEIENVSSSWAPDVRLVDGVPEGLAVQEGSPRHGTALRPGASSRFSYTVSAPRGHHEFETAYLATRNPTGTIERSEYRPVDGDESITYDISKVATLSMPLRKRASKHVGRVLTDVGGSGLEFHSVREYRSGDPLSRIDWNRAAQGRDLATLQFREERSATVMILIDGRDSAYVGSHPDHPSAIDRSVLAASDLVSALLGDDDRVGVGAISPRQCWLDPGAGSKHLAQAQDLLADHEAFGPTAPDRPFITRIGVPAIHKRLPADAQLIVFSPLCDVQIVTVIRRLQAYGYPVTVVSPDVTTTRSSGRTLVTIERRLRLSRLRRTDVRVVDWKHRESLAIAIERAQRGWSR